ncbi:hypothetical protein EC253486_2229 [Escherichia coli 2534-86]|nr:hypothetical protein ECoL_01148 [Escherichia coli EC4100B]EGW73669.1 hypothetical protein EC253486_2229 [Escherichia coli 2534-86]EHW25412.1 hypothetical protein ECDEC8E_3865 [Escherichia coli DEC8E]EIH76154.1 hypothetical protein EC40522_4139 [Escherichia coli 4.0522]
MPPKSLLKTSSATEGVTNEWPAGGVGKAVLSVQLADGAADLTSCKSSAEDPPG